MLLGLAGPVGKVVGSTFESATARGHVSEHQPKGLVLRFKTALSPPEGKENGQAPTSTLRDSQSYRGVVQLSAEHGVLLLQLFVAPQCGGQLLFDLFVDAKLSHSSL